MANFVFSITGTVTPTDTDTRYFETCDVCSLLESSCS